MIADFLWAILEDPFDDTPRLVYADWLEEYGGDPLRAEFIRAQCSAALRCSCAYVSVAFGQGIACPECSRRPEARRHEYDLWLEGRAYWGARLPSVLWGATNEPSWWCRGFVFRARCSSGDLLRHAETLFRSQPITEVELTDASMLRELARGHWGWSLLRLPVVLRERMPVRWFDYPGVASAALSRACVSYGRDLAGLPPLKESKS